MTRTAAASVYAVVDALERRAVTRGISVPALTSVRELVANGEPDMAIDYLVNTVNSFRLLLGRAEYTRLLSAAAELDYDADDLTDLEPRLLVADPDQA
ncbi:hypothetical protein [Streptomyces albipurpureus]|uniref:Uncharacterized protein n=1 Tax=Streptomyces albipurpureus TaxID=2897419 RepID=A0ABT0UIX4_9ACTN|nr:hypothetical protein [Streptomyces sp. CWNU-1]MCM2388187.1 hypothetical protein [Streptomyces sp. CWNU-1]